MRSLIEDKPNAIEIPPNGNSLDLLQAVYRSSDLPLTTRLRAAISALPHEVPRLAVTAQVTEQDFATLLDRRLQRLDEMRRLESNGGGQIEAKAIEAEPTQSEPAIEARPPSAQASLARIYSPKFKRRF